MKKINDRNFYSLHWLRQFLKGHRGFVAGGAVRAILAGDKVKDIDIFFETEGDFLEAVDHFNSMTAEHSNKPVYRFKYRNAKVCAFQPLGESYWIELVETIFGTPEEVIKQFDFTVAKVAYSKTRAMGDEQALEIEAFGSEYAIDIHGDFFEHLHTKHLVLDDGIPFPFSTFTRVLRYTKKGYNLCNESKKKLCTALRETLDTDFDNDFYGGFD